MVEPSDQHCLGRQSVEVRAESPAVGRSAVLVPVAVQCEQGGCGQHLRGAVRHERLPAGAGETGRVVREPFLKLWVVEDGSYHWLSVVFGPGALLGVADRVEVCPVEAVGAGSAGGWSAANRAHSSRCRAASSTPSRPGRAPPSSRFQSLSRSSLGPSSCPGSTAKAKFAPEMAQYSRSPTRSECGMSSRS